MLVKLGRKNNLTILQSAVDYHLKDDNWLNKLKIPSRMDGLGLNKNDFIKN